MPLVLSSNNPPPAQSEPEEIIDPKVGDTDNNIDEVADVIIHEPETHVTEEALVTVEEVANPTPWVDSTVVSEASPELRVHVNGKPWYVDFFKQVSGPDDVVDQNTPLVSGAYQQFALIEDMLLMVETPLESETDPETKVTSVSGSATIDGILVPNTGDSFKANLGDGRTGILTLKQVTPLSIHKGKAYRVTYTLTSIGDETQTQLADLMSKVIVTYKYDDEAAVLGRKALLTTEAVVELQDRNRSIQDLEEGYFKRFYEREINSLAVRTSTEVIYDPYVVNFVRATFTNRPESIIPYKPDALAEDTVYDYLKTRRGYPTFFSNDAVQALLVGKGTENPTLNKFRYVGITALVTADRTDAARADCWGLVAQDALVSLSTVTENGSYPVNIDGEAQPLYPDVINSPKYVMSPEFYHGEGDMSVLEELVFKWCRGDKDDGRRLSPLVTKLGELTPTEQYYLIPMVLFLLRVTGV